MFQQPQKKFSIFREAREDLNKYKKFLNPLNNLDTKVVKTFIPVPHPKHEIQFSPYVWAKLLYFRDKGSTEIGGFGIVSLDNPFYVYDFVTIKQQVTSVSTSFDDTAVADFFDQQTELGRIPKEFARVWLHTHPAIGAKPSGTDERTFFDVFGKCDWAIMFILAKDGEMFSRIRFNVGPGGEVEFKTKINYSLSFPASNFEAWDKEYTENICPEAIIAAFSDKEEIQSWKEYCKDWTKEQEDHLSEEDRHYSPIEKPIDEFGMDEDSEFEEWWDREKCL